MKRKNNPIYISLLVALPLAIVIGILLPVKHERYRAQIVDQENRVGFNSKSFVDWDNDGLPEYVVLSENMVGNAAIKPYTHEGKSLGQFNLESKFTNELPLHFFADVYGNGNQVLFLLTQKNDSLFINGFDLVSLRFLTYQRFVDIVPVVDGRNDFSALFFDAFEANHDGAKEIYLFINAGFSLQPRNMYRYDVLNDSIVKSPESFSKVTPTALFDIDNDGIGEIICSNRTTDNCSDSVPVPYPDSVNWAFVFTPELQFKFPPKHFEGAVSSLQQLPFKLENRYGILALYSKRAAGSFEDCLIVLSADGQLIKKLVLPHTSNNNDHKLFLTDKDYENFLLVLSDGTKYKIDKNFNLGKRVRRKIFLNYSSALLIKADENRNFYLLTNIRENKMALSDLGLQYISELQIPFHGRTIFSVKDSKENLQLYIQNTETGYHISYFKNRFFYAEFLIYPGLYSLFVLLSFVVIRSQQKKIVRQYETEKKLSEMQFQNLKSQLAPHFTYNVLNSIGSMIKSGEAEDAYNYLAKNSKMMRSLMDDANEITHSLKKEVEFVQDYLALQKLRFKDRYQFDLQVEKGINMQIGVPKMVIYNYVENALKHGLKNIRENGKVHIQVKNTGRQKLLFTVSDNGTGIRAEEVKKNHGKGLKLMDQYFKLFEEYYGYKIRTEINAMEPQNRLYPGTIVKIEIELPFAGKRMD